MFNPKNLPSNVRTAWNAGSANWMRVVEEAIKIQMTDIAEVTDVVFHLHHKERKGKPLNPSDFGLIAEWRAMHTLVKARLYGGQNAQSGANRPGDVIFNQSRGHMNAWHELVLMGDVAAARGGRKAFPLYHRAVFTNDSHASSLPKWYSALVTNEN